MSNSLRYIKKIALFLFGVVLIIWGYKANNTNNEETALNPNGEVEEPTVNTVQQNSNKEQETKSTTADKKDTAIETATPEESSATQ